MAHGPSEIQHLLVSELIRSEDLQQCIDRGLQPSWFAADISKDVYVFILDFYRDRGVFPSYPTITREFPEFTAIATSDPLAYFIDKFITMHRRQVAVETVREAVQLLHDNDSEAAIGALGTGMANLESYSPVPIRITDLTKDISGRIDAYLERARSGALLGYTTGYPTIDTAGAGMQPEQLYILIAQQKRGKTTLSLNMAIAAHDHHDIPVMMVSFEMGARELAARHDAIRARIPLDAVQKGSFTSVHEDRLRDLGDELDSKAPLWIMDASEGATISALTARVERYEPDLLIVDGVYLMTDEVSGEVNTPQAITNLTRGLKRVAQRFKIPVVATSQALESKTVRGRLTDTSGGYSSSYGQDADVLLGLEYDDPVAGRSPDPYVRKLRILISRNSGPAETLINFDYETGDFAEAGAL